MNRGNADEAQHPKYLESASDPTVPPKSRCCRQAGALALGSLLAWQSSAQLGAWRIETIIGGLGDGGPATEAQLQSPSGVAVDGSGNVYVADFGDHRVRRIDARTGVIETVAGTGTEGYGGYGGPATEAQLQSPSGVAVDGSGNVYITDRGNYLVGKIDAGTGMIETVTGTGEYGYDGVAVDVSGNVYVADRWNHRVRRIDAGTGVIETVAGTGRGGYYGDGGPATAAQLWWPEGVAVASSGNVYVADTGSHRIRRIDAGTGVIETVAGTGEAGYGGDGGPAKEAELRRPEGVAVDGSGNVYVADVGNHRVRRIDARTGVIETVAGTGEAGYGGDGGPATAAQLWSRGGVAVDGSGNVYVADVGNHRVRRIDARTGMIETVAGRGEVADQLQFPAGVAVAGSGDVYIADAGRNQIRRIDAGTGVIETVAGTRRAGYYGDGGPATAAQLWSPEGVAVAGSGNVYVADAGSHRIRRIDVGTGVIETVAGTGEEGYGGDGGPATEAQLAWPAGVAVNVSGDVYVADVGNHRVRRIDVGTGVIETVAGTGEWGYGGDGGSAKEAELRRPEGVAVDGSGNVYVADVGNHRVRRIDAGTGVIETAAGTGEEGYGGDGGPATEAQLAWPAGVAVNVSGDVYVVDYGNYRVRRIDARTGMIETVAGTGESAGSGPATGDGRRATEVSLVPPLLDVAVGGSSAVYFTAGDAVGPVVYKLTPPPDVGFALGDQNGDGRDDVLLRHADGRWYYYPMDGRRHIVAGRGPANLSKNPDWRFAGLGDLNGDGRDDALLRHVDGRWHYYPMDGRRHIVAGLGTANLTSNLDWRLAGLGDLNGDGRDDALLRHVDGRWYYYPMDGRRHIVAGRGPANLSKNLDWRFAGLGDLNGDGRDDALLRHVDGRWYYYPMNGRRHVVAGRGTVVDLPRGLDWRLAGLGDLNGDGRDDVLLRHVVDGSWYYYPMDGKRVLAAQAGKAKLRDDDAWRLAGLGDLNGDGRDDVLLRHVVAGRWLYYPMNGREVVAAERGGANLTRDPNWFTVTPLGP